MNSILSPGGVNGSTLQYSCLENFMDRRDRQTAVHRVIKNQTWLNTPAAAAKSLQSCPTLRPHRQQPTRLPRPWDSPGRTLEWVAISFSNAWKGKSKVKALTRVQLFTTPWTAAHQAPPSMGFSRKASISALLPMPKPLTVWITINCGKFWKRWQYQTTWSASWEICMQVRKQQLELDMEQQTGSK